MTKTPKKPVSPTITLSITPEHHARAVASASGSCLIADPITEQHPRFSAVMVDMATVRVTDREKGLRYTYLTPPAAQHILLAFDQGWPHPFETVTLRRAVKITRIMRAKSETAARKVEREAKRVELETKRESGETLTPSEKATLTKVSKPYTPRERPTARGPIEDVIDNPRSEATIIGGDPIPLGPAHPNLLRSRNRFFGAKLAHPGTAFQEAVDIAVAERLANPTLD